MSKIKLDKIEDAISAIKNGEIIIVVDDENRENEGDFITAAETIDSSKINFMAKNGRGLICVPLTDKRSKELHLSPMVSNNTDPMDTAFTVSVDLRGNGVTSGISTSDRAKTIKALVDNYSTDFGVKAHYSGLPYIRTVDSIKVKKENSMFILFTLIITALIYGERPIRIIEKFWSPPPIRAEKNESPFCPSIAAARPVVFTPGIGITERNLYTSTKRSVAIIFLLRSFIEIIDLSVFSIIG